MKKRTLILSLFVLIAFTNVKASSIKDTTTTPVIGQLCPDLFFDKTINFDKPSFNLHELRGKWVLLDFWDWGCSGCIADFPHVSELQRKYKDQIQILMVTDNDWEGKNAAIYNRYMKMLKLNMPCVFNGTSDKNGNLTGVFKQFNITSLGRDILIDPQGIVRAYTDRIPDKGFQELMDGAKPTFTYDRFAPTFKRIDYHTPKPNLERGQKIEFLSAISNSSPDLGGISLTFDFPPYWDDYPKPESGKLELINFDLKALYKVAFWGGGSFDQIDKVLNHQTFWPYPLLEMKDTSQFVPDNFSNKNRFCYSMIAPVSKTTTRFMLEAMQEDLKRYFGYSASIEMRKMPYYRLVVVDSKLAEKLKTRGGIQKSEEIIHEVSYKYTNYPLSAFFNWMKATKKAPMVDETGIKYNIDLTYTAPYANFEGNNEALAKIGLKMVKGEKEMKVLVIRDPKPDSTAVN